MLTCIACSKQIAANGSLHDQPDEDDAGGTPSTRHAIKALTSQLKDMALKASGAYRHCKPCAGPAVRYADSEIGSRSDRVRHYYRRAAEGSGASTPRESGRDVVVMRGGISSGEVTPPSMSGRRDDSGPSTAAFMDDELEGEEGEKEWVAQVEPGVLITFVSLLHGAGNDLKRIRFSRELFNKWQAQRWWAENYDRVMELYNVQRFNRQAALPTPPRSEDESSKIDSAEDSPVTPPLGKERLPRNFSRPMTTGSTVYSSSDSLENHEHHPRHHSRHRNDYGLLASTPKLSSISGAKSETSSMDASVRTSSSPGELDRSGELSATASNASDQETEWVEQDEPGVYITVRALPGGGRELRRVRFSRERFGEMHARMWWEENRARIQEQYL